MNERFALDIVLLPDDRAAQAAIALSAGLQNHRNDRRLFLNPQDRIPHISLSMGIVSKDDLPALNEQVTALGANLPRLLLSTLSVAGPNEPDDSISMVRLVLSEELRDFHVRAMAIMPQLPATSATVNDFADSTRIENGTLSWVDHFARDAAFDRFAPHITLGYGRPATRTFPETFLADRLAVCHLGEHCTCSKIVFEVPLES